MVVAGAFMVKRGNNVAGAWDLLKFLMSDESMADFVQITKRVPMKRKATPLWVQDYQKTTQGAESVVQAMSSGRSFPYQYPPILTTRLFDIVHLGISRLFKNENNAQVIMADVGRQLEAYMAEVTK
jgi:hypothetical protein